MYRFFSIGKIFTEEFLGENITEQIQKSYLQNLTYWIDRESIL